MELGRSHMMGTSFETARMYFNDKALVLVKTCESRTRHFETLTNADERHNWIALAISIRWFICTLKILESESDDKEISPEECDRLRNFYEEHYQELKKYVWRIEHSVMDIIQIEVLGAEIKIALLEILNLDKMMNDDKGIAYINNMFTNEENGIDNHFARALELTEHYGNLSPYMKGVLEFPRFNAKEIRSYLDYRESQDITVFDPFYEEISSFYTLLIASSKPVSDIDLLCRYALLLTRVDKYRAEYYHISGMDAQSKICKERAINTLNESRNRLPTTPSQGFKIAYLFQEKIIQTIREIEAIGRDDQSAV